MPFFSFTPKLTIRSLPKFVLFDPSQPLIFPKLLLNSAVGRSALPYVISHVPLQTFPRRGEASGLQEDDESDTIVRKRMFEHISLAVLRIRFFVSLLCSTPIEIPYF